MGIKSVAVHAYALVDTNTTINHTLKQSLQVISASEFSHDLAERIHVAIVLQTAQAECAPALGNASISSAEHDRLAKAFTQLLLWISIQHQTV